LSLDPKYYIGTSKFRAALSVIMLLAKHGGTLTSSEMAQQMKVHAAYLRKVNAEMIKAGFIEAREGHDGGYILRLPASEISMADVYKAVRGEGKGPTDPSCNLTEFLTNHLKHTMVEVDECIMACLKAYKIEDMVNDFEQSLH